MAAFKASKLVWSAMRATALTMSPMVAACFSSSTTMRTESNWRCAATPTLVIRPATSPLVRAISVWQTSPLPVLRSAFCNCRVIETPTCWNAARDSCAALEASSAPAAIWSLARFRSSAADDASAMPEANCPVAAAIRSAACCCLARVLAFLRCASASRAVTADDFPSIETEVAWKAAFLTSAKGPFLLCWPFQSRSSVIFSGWNSRSGEKCVRSAWTRKRCVRMVVKSS